jgi:hypothetical protein
MARAHQTEFFTNGGGRVADLVDGLLQFVLRHAQGLGPVLDLEILVHVDLRAVALVFLGEIVHAFLHCEINAG